MSFSRPSLEFQFFCFLQNFSRSLLEFDLHFTRSLLEFYLSPAAAFWKGGLWVLQRFEVASGSGISRVFSEEVFSCMHGVASKEPRTPQ